MGFWLKQSTVVTVKVGPFLDSSDGNTTEEALTISQADIRLSKNGGAFAQSNNAAGATHDENGWYGVPLDTADTGALGTLAVAIHKSGALAVWVEFMVVPANMWDSLFGADRLQVDVREKGDSTLALTTQEKADVNTEADTALTDYDAPTKAEMDTGHGLLATEAKQDIIDTVVDAIKAVTDLLPDSGALSDLATILTDTNELQVDWANGGRLDLLLDAVKVVTDLLPNAGALSDLATILTDTNELQTDWTNGGRLDLLIDAIKAVTDLLPDAGALNDLATVLTDTNEVQGKLPTNNIMGSSVKTDKDDEIDAILLDTGTDGVLLAADQPVDATKISGSSAAADNLEASAEVIIVGAAAAGTLSTTQMTTNLTEATDDHYIGRVVIWTSGVLLGQATDITDYDGGTKMLTFTAVTEAPTVSDTFVIV